MKEVLERALRGDINPKTGSPESIADIIVDIMAQERVAARENRRSGVEIRNAAGDFEPLPDDFGSASRAAEISKERFGVEPGDLAFPGDYQDKDE